MIDPRDHYFLIHDAPFSMMSRHLAQWLTGLDVWGNVRYLNAGDRNMDCQANAGIAKALRSDAGWFVFIESDIRPHANITSGFWESEADVVGCIYPTESQHAWDEPRQIHSGLWRTRRHVLTSIEPPWFAWKRNKIGTKTVGCICSTFCEKILAAGFSVEQAGHAQHTPRACPPGMAPPRARKHRMIRKVQNEEVAATIVD